MGFSQGISPALLIPTLKVIMCNLFSFHHFIFEKTVFPLSIFSAKDISWVCYQGLALCYLWEGWGGIVFRITAEVCLAVDSLSKIQLCPYQVRERQNVRLLI
jgi:hypothetical protein